jgi:hypothetical protein
MADYYPLISRAVAGLDKNNGESRRTLYDRARAALLAQLRSVTPALSESDITRERLALEESIRKVEAEAARQFVEPSRQPPAPRTRPAEPHQPEFRSREASADARQREDDPSAPPPRRYVNPPSPGQEGRQEATRRLRSSPLPDARRPHSAFDQPPSPSDPSVPTPASPPPPRHPLRRSPGERRSLSDSVLQDFRSGVSEEGGAQAARERASPDAFGAAALPATDLNRPPRRQERFDRPEARTAEPSAPQERSFEPRHEPPPHDGFSEPMLESSFAVDDARAVPNKARRAAADDDEEVEPGYEYREEHMRRRSYGHLLKGLAAAVVVGAIGGALVWQWPRMVDIYRSFRVPSTEVAREIPAPAAPKKTQERVEPGTVQQQVVTAPAAQQLAAVAQKVVLYEEDPGDPNGKRFVGSAIWRTETVTSAPGQTPDLAIRADVEVPERKLAMTWVLRRNTDKGLPATHTVEIMFKLPADFPAGGITNVPGILMKQAEQTRGVPLAGSAVKVTNGFYLIGLSNVDADKERNVQLLKERAWFDIPVVYNNNRRAILAMEKGTPGERVFADAFKAWKQ